jgi:ferredoxin--NADP+ reductase
MAYGITDAGGQACPVDGIHPKQDEAGFAEAPQLYLKPDDCIDCGVVRVCPTNSIFVLDELPEEYAKFADIHAAHYNHAGSTGGGSVPEKGRPFKRARGRLEGVVRQGSCTQPCTSGA